MSSINVDVLKEWIEKNEEIIDGYYVVISKWLLSFIDANSKEERSAEPKSIVREQVLQSRPAGYIETIEDKLETQGQQIGIPKDTPVTYSLEKRHTFDCQCSFCREMRGEGSGGTR